MELKVGMYIRSKDKRGGQFIRKIVDLPKDTRCGSIIVDKDIHNVEWVSMKNVLNVSDNIIDLIEVGDYVNGYKVEAVYLKGYRKYIKLSNAYESGKGIRTYSEDIKSVVTKEQFSSVKYEVG